MSIRADLTEAPRGLIRASLSIPVKSGPLTLLYPQWIPGDHAPTGPITDLASLTFTAGGKPVAWRRDLVNMYALHLDVPQGVTTLDASLEYLAPTGGENPSENGTTSDRLAVLEWNLVTLSPQGRDASKLMVAPAIVLPKEWQFACTMEKDASAPGDGAIHFQPVSLEMLIDQPLIAGKHFKEIDLTPDETPRHAMAIAADSEAALKMNARRRRAYRRVPEEYAALFGARHYNQYLFIVALSERVGQTGLEHHQCSVNRAQERALVDDDQFAGFANLLTHEYFHSWNGKYRRPADLLSPDFQKPMKDDLLWVYEGLTEYYGDVMAARTGLWKDEEYRENIALVAATLAARQGRTWRPLQDTADMASKLYGASKNWSMRRRGVDFYGEGDLIWLDADTLIRQKTDGEKSLDDFCQAFYGTGSGSDGLQGAKPTVVTYMADDVFKSLNSIVARDWKAFFNTRLTSLDPQPPLGGVTQGGWKLVYTDKPNKIQQAASKADKKHDLRFSLGLVMDSDDDNVIDVVPGSPADKAGVGPNMKVIAVNGRKIDDEVLSDAIKATSDTKNIELLLENASYFITAKLDYDGGPRYPHLERVESSADLLAKIIAPRAKKDKERQDKQ